MKKIIALVLALMLTVTCFAACGKTGGDAKKKYTVGICNYVDDASLNQIVDNIKKQLASVAAEKGVEIEVKYDNCNGDSVVMNQIISNFIVDKVDLMVGVATPVAIAMQAAVETENSDIPVVFSAVSDPIGSKLVESLDAPGGQITGTSDYLNTNAIMDLILLKDPDIKKVGLLYDVGQDSSTKPIADAKAYLEAKGIEVIERTGTTVDEVTLAAKALVSDGVQVVFTPTDNTIMKSELSIYEIFADAKIPQYAGADSFALNGAFLGYGVDYINLGRETADQIAEILIDGKKPADVPVRTFDNGTATVNTDVAKELGFEFDKLSDLYAPYCTKVQSIITAESFDDVQ